LEEDDGLKQDQERQRNEEILEMKHHFVEGNLPIGR
jgi:hypothetical protein